ncbi:hypothetical protein BH09BAC3_BH09BAC3_15080 [soil metagenome]
MKILSAVTLCLILLSCGREAKNSAESTVAPSGKLMETANLDSKDESGASSSVEVIDRKLIRNGDINLKVDDVAKTKEEIEKISKELSGYISNETQNNYGDRVQYNQIIRIPANKFDGLVKQIEALANKVESKNINTQDVTEEYIDIEARLKTKKELEERYREILKQAKTVADILSIESQIASVRSEIESMEGRLNYLKNQVSFSTLNVSYYQSIGTDFGFGSKFIHSIGEGWENLLGFLITITMLWPFVIAAGLAFWWWRRRR